MSSNKSAKRFSVWLDGKWSSPENFLTHSNKEKSLNRATESYQSQSFAAEPPALIS